MEKLIYTKIRSEKQYNEYCLKLRDLLIREQNGEDIEEHIDLLSILIEDWDSEHLDLVDLDPIELILSLKNSHNISQAKLAEIAGIKESYMSEILNYKKQLSKRVIRNIANHFKIRQEVLNRPYKLINPLDSAKEEESVAKEVLAMNVFLKSTSEEDIKNTKDNKGKTNVVVPGYYLKFDITSSKGDC